MCPVHRGVQGSLRIRVPISLREETLYLTQGSNRHGKGIGLEEVNRRPIIQPSQYVPVSASAAC